MRSCKTRKHGPDSEPGSRVPCAATHTRSSEQEQEGEADGAPAPCTLHHVTVDVLRCTLHHVTVDVLRAAFLGLKKRAAAGIDRARFEVLGKHDQAGSFL
jgi:hypothetical protein